MEIPDLFFTKGNSTFQTVFDTLNELQVRESPSVHDLYIDWKELKVLNLQT